MKRTLHAPHALALLLTAFLTRPLGAAAVSFSIEPLFSVHTGYLGEHLFTTDTDVDNPETSFLQWELCPLLTAGIQGSIRISNFTAEVQFSAGLPGDMGSMYDSDWFDNTWVKQSLSKSDEILTEAWYTDILMGWNVPLSEKARLMPFIGFSYHFINMTAPAGGTGTADSNPYDGIIVAYDSAEAVSTATAQLDYWRETICTWAGVRLHADIHRHLSLALSVALSPFTNVLSLDHHYNNGYYFADKPYGFFHAVQTDMLIVCAVHRHIGIFLRAKCTALSTVTGKTYTSRTAGYLGEESTASYAGASELDAEFSLGIQFSL